MSVYAQTDSSISVITLNLDTTWNSTIDEADLILHVRIENSIYVTDGGSFTGNVLQVLKGNYSSKTISFNLGLIEFSRERYEKRFRAITPVDWKTPYTVYIGFKKTEYAFDFEDPITKQKYVFFMSVEKM